MGSSLQEQLLKAGLVTEQQVRREKARGTEAVRRGQKHRKAPQAVRHRTQQSTAAAVSKPTQESPAGTVPTVAKQSEQQDKKTASPSDRKLLRARIKILLRRHRVNDAEAETPYHFLVGKHIRRIYVPMPNMPCFARASWSSSLLESGIIFYRSIKWGPCNNSIQT